MNKINNIMKSDGISLSMIVFIIFLVLKLTDNIDWSWIWVLSPLWIGFAIAIIIIIANIGAVGSAFGLIFGNIATLPAVAGGIGGFAISGCSCSGSDSGSGCCSGSDSDSGCCSDSDSYSGYSFSVPPNILLGFPTVVCPEIYALSFGLNSRLISRPAVIAAAIPPAVAFRPPIKIPRKPSFSIASRTPFANE